MAARRLTRVKGWPPRDRSGAIEPHKLNAISAFRRALPWLVRAFQTKVPEQYWSAYLDHETDEEVAVVECGCGAVTRAGGATFAECVCGRFFLFLGDQVRCFKPEADEGEEGAEDRPES